MMTIAFFQNLKRFLGGLANSLTQWNNNFEVYNNQDYFITSRGALGGFVDSAGVKSFTTILKVVTIEFSHDIL